MKAAKSILLVMSLTWGSSTECFGQAPPNDNFTNATVLTGENIIFKGDLTGSSAEPPEVYGAPFVDSEITQHSIWWAWTATQSGPVTLVVLSYSHDNYFPENPAESFVAIYCITNDLATIRPDGTRQFPPALNGTVLDASLYKLSLTFNATAGSNYQIQMGDFRYGTSVLQVTFQLIATNAPIILDQPADQTIGPGCSALFTVLADGVQPLNYQWCSNGVAVPGATFPMLALDNVTSDQAAAYTVVVSNATGVLTSQVANLTVTTNVSSPVVNYLGATTNGFAFSLAGDTGRYWRIESSTDLVSWQPENSFPSPPGPVIYLNLGATIANTNGSLVFTTNSLISLVVPANGAAKFLRAHGYAAPNEICNNDLKRIRFAKLLWARSVHAGRFGWPALVDLEKLYGIDNSVMSCPIGGFFVHEFQNVVTAPRCNVPSHILEEPR